MDQAGNPRIISEAKCVDVVLRRIIEAAPFLQMIARPNKRAAPEQGHPQRPMPFQLVSGIALLSRQSKHFFGKIAGCLPFRTYKVVYPKAAQDREPLPRILRFTT